MSGIPYYRYEGSELSEKFAWVNGTPGMEAVAPAADGVRNMGQTLGGIADDAGRTMRDLGVSWTGPASDAAGRSAHQVVRSAAHTEDLAQNGADRMMDYGRSFEWLRSQVAYDDPATHSTFQKFVDYNSDVASWVWPPAGDRVTIGERNQANDDVANRAFAQHEANARLAEDGFATAGADPPPGAGPGGVVPGGTGAVSGPGPGGAPHVATASAAPSATGTPGTAPAVPAPAGAAPAGTGPGAAGIPVPAGAAPGVNGTGRTGAPAAGTGTGPGTAGTGRGRTPDGTTVAAGAPGTTGRGTAPDAGAGADRQRADLGQRFGNDLRSRGLGTPSAPGGGGVVAPYGGRYGEAFGRGPAGVGGRPGYGGAGAGSSPGYGGESGSRAAPGVPRSGTGLPGEGFGARAGAVEPAVSGRAGATGAGAGFAPMMGAGGMRSDGQGHHRNRYLLTSSEPFEVDVPYAPPVLGPDDDGEVPA